jgi:hypothetical protein
MDNHLQQICSGSVLPGEAVRQLAETGFAIISGPLSGNRFAQMATTYDELIAAASGPDIKIGSTTTRMSGLLGYSSVFDDVFLYGPLLEACWQVIGDPFKLSAFLARTLRPGTPAQELHADLPRDSEDAPLLGFILMIDPFQHDNGATRFIPTSHRWPDLPGDRLSNLRTTYPGEILGCGDPGTMILFNAAIWHGHTANVTPHARRSIQGYFVRRNARAAFDFSNHLPPAAHRRPSQLAEYLLALPE